MGAGRRGKQHFFGVCFRACSCQITVHMHWEAPTRARLFHKHTLSRAWGLNSVATRARPHLAHSWQAPIHPGLKCNVTAELNCMKDFAQSLWRVWSSSPAAEDMMTEARVPQGLDELGAQAPIRVLALRRPCHLLQLFCNVMRKFIRCRGMPPAACRPLSSRGRGLNPWEVEGLAGF